MNKGNHPVLKIETGFQQNTKRELPIERAPENAKRAHNHLSEYDSWTTIIW